MPTPAKPEINVTVFTDYICPFCYVGDARLDQLRDRFALDVDWCFFEIHPDNPPQGKPVTELGYAPDVWASMMANLQQMARADGLPLAERTFTTNSHRALLLAEAAKTLDEATFGMLHKRLFEAYFVERLNIGDTAVLRALAADCAIAADVVERAWSDAEFEQRLKTHSWRAAQTGVHGVPAYLFGKYLVSGAVPVETLVRAAEMVVADQAMEIGT